MNFEAMNMFLSAENIKKHLEHLRTLRLKYSVLEKSVPEIAKRDILEISKLRISSQIREEATRLLWNIRSHELFFDSFTDRPTWTNKEISREKLMYDILQMSYDKDYGFIYIYNDRNGRIKISHSIEYDGAFVTYTPGLCIDVCEHVYFCDYGFKKDRYVGGALSYLNTGKLT